jgi:hypothetical protein
MGRLYFGDNLDILPKRPNTSIVAGWVELQEGETGKANRRATNIIREGWISLSPPKRS